MSLEGVIQNGRVELDVPADLPDGTRVRVEPVVANSTEQPAPKKELSSLNKFLLSISGKAKGLPPDMALNHDHYIHGTGKQ